MANISTEIRTKYPLSTRLHFYSDSIVM